MTDERAFRTLSSSLTALRRAGENGPKSLAAMRTAGNAALLILIECEMARMMREAAGTDPMSEAIVRASRKAEEDDD